MMEPGHWRILRGGTRNVPPTHTPVLFPSFFIQFSVKILPNHKLNDERFDWWIYYCLSNRKFERLGSPIDEIVTVFIHKYNIIMSRPIMTSSHRLFWETGCQDVGCFIENLYGYPTWLASKTTTLKHRSNTILSTLTWHLLVRLRL